MNLRELISEVKDYTLEAVPVPEWKTTVYLREITVAERVKLFAVLEGKSLTDTPLCAHVLLYALCDQDGKRVFTDDDYDVLASKNAKVIKRLGTRAAEMNGMLSDAVEDAKKN